MRCTEARALLSAHLDGDLTAGADLRMEGHLATCGMCRREWQNLQRTTRLVARLAPERCPVDLRHSVMQAVSQQRPQQTWGFRVPRLAVAAVASASVAVLVAGGAYLSSSEPGKESIAAGVPESRSLLEQSLHEQYRLAGGLGMDGLMLSMTPEPETAAQPGAEAAAADGKAEPKSRQPAAPPPDEKPRSTPNL
jgi:predicted anti-sigma-YlaC factor YlaD